jgi:hypothetical protein
MGHLKLTLWFLTVGLSLLRAFFGCSSATGLFSEASMNVIENLPLETLVVRIRFIPLIRASLLIPPRQRR